MLTANIYCGQYLPTWRPDTDYTKSYSADISKGGGVLLDLSHEIDYAQWLCGKITEVKSYQKKISDLDIKSDDMTCLIGKTDKGVYINLTIDYISKITQRRLLLHTIDKSFDLDLINNILIEANKNGIEKRYTSPTLERNHMFSAMHNSILDGKTSCCTLAQALDVMETIFMIQEENNE
jgi:CMP-N,N'-diacetyllegionaminic acid synthase